MNLDEMWRQIEQYNAAINTIARSKPGEDELFPRTVALYLEHESVKVTAAQLREEGYEMPDGRAVQPGDVSTILYSSNEPCLVRPAALHMAQEIFERNRNGAMERWN